MKNFDKYLDKIYTDLQRGVVYGKNMTHEKYAYIKYDYFEDCLFLNWQRTISWRHYGESANPNTKSDLRWILKNIFKMTAKDFINTYETRI